MKIKHLSVNSCRPKRSSEILAELTNGEAKAFPSKTMTGAWMCVWSESDNELIELIPVQYKLTFGDLAAIYEDQGKKQNFHASHFMLEANKTVDELVAIAEKYQLTHRFRKHFGGPLYEVWLEDGLLVEFCSAEISKL
ncbi:MULTISPECIES: hypothetical protein [unclassified Salinivibrio]|uniref:hypothetical protein n=1 Tax=unclassified Salinivibrio TaxID=2636825 RepID=UPI00128B67BE|nr:MULTISPECIES: hypothetical protein [unclassified Salinivibrio]MPS33050.1 hypothetical protein [Salinivibrio sp. VYel7]MPX91553.1 hypothetical protein [Salinivibrio sp. VYel1]MPX94436.1 hypothetical protein [Salinivibrio sp. VYel9]MPX95066.1 hypothetical protein [Salinivibrio sp. VYel6]MPY00814.1 hypothetical protein [Salinivibrio sp. VYel4]